MKIIGLVLLVGCLMATIRVSADPYSRAISRPRLANRLGPSQGVGDRFAWRVRAGAGGSIVQRTSDGGHSWQDRTPHGFTQSAPDLNDEDFSPMNFGLSALDARRCWVAFVETLRGQFVITVERTADGGQHWRRAVFPGRGDDVILQFLDPRHGFLLGQKDFYRSDDGGKTWALGGSADVKHDSYYPFVIDGYYPSGMAFRNVHEGWITGIDHGTGAEVPLVQTRDGGRTWKFQAIPMPASYPNAYGDASQPRFCGRSRRRGAFTVELRNKFPKWAQTVNYVTRDGGEHWHIAGPIRRQSH